MKLTVVRFGLGLKSTLSRIYVDGKFVCFGLEDARRKEKIYGETCIPEGMYQLRPRTEGSFAQRYGVRFRDLKHKAMIEIDRVPGFDDVLIHMGNKHEDTAGCLLVGEGVMITPKGEFIVVGSEKAYRVLYPMIIEEVKRAEAVNAPVLMQVVIQGRVDVPIP